MPSYCVEFLPYGDFLAAYIAIVGLYFVITSLDAWKNQYKFEEAVKTIEQFDQQLPILQLIVSKIYQLVHECESNNYYDMFGAEKNFQDMLKMQRIYERLGELQDYIRNNKNNLHQNLFESNITDFEEAINEALQCVQDAHLSEPNYGDNEEHNLETRKKKVEKVKKGLTQLKLRNEKFVSNYNNLKSKFELN
ncbi:hypothetical protein ACINWC743_A0621 [Acinetobacter sp. WC-743]|nr:hypothetical protein ACINWC743_A0621 [Acinetobacter sp. WC-743]